MFIMNPTDELLFSAFRQLLEEKPYKKITVRDIVDRCHVNRNTFYYHFEGIPDLMDHYLTHWSSEILLKAESAEDPLLALIPAAEEIKEYRTAVLHLSDSRAWPDVLRHLEFLCGQLSSHYIKAAAAGAAALNDAENHGPVPLSEEDCAALTRFYTSVLYGCILSWLKADMSYDLPSDLLRVSRLIRRPRSGQGAQAGS